MSASQQFSLLFSVSLGHIPAILLPKTGKISKQAVVETQKSTWAHRLAG